MIVPPLTLYGALQRGPAALAINLGFAAAIAAFAWWMIELTGNFPQWSAVALGYYAVFSWACTLRARDPATFRLIRSEEHTSELQSLMRISYAVFCLKKKKHTR